MFGHYDSLCDSHYVTMSQCVTVWLRYITVSGRGLHGVTVSSLLSSTLSGVAGPELGGMWPVGERGDRLLCTALLAQWDTQYYRE